MTYKLTLVKKISILLFYILMLFGTRAVLASENCSITEGPFYYPPSCDCVETSVCNEFPIGSGNYWFSGWTCYGSSQCPSGDYGHGYQCIYDYDACSGGNPPPPPAPPSCNESNPSAPTLVSPANGSNTNIGTVALTWNQVTNWGKNCDGNNPPAADKKYRVYFGQQGSKTLIATVTDPTVTRNVTVQTGKTYEWQIGAYNSDSGLETKSATWTFVAGSPPTGSITSPLDGATFNKYTMSSGTYNTAKISVNASDANDGIATIQVYVATQSDYNANPNSASIWTQVGSDITDCNGATTCNRTINWTDPPVGYKVLTVNIKNTKNEWCSTNQPVGATVGFAPCGQGVVHYVVNSPPSGSISINPNWPISNGAYQFNIDDGNITFSATATDAQLTRADLYIRPQGGSAFTRFGTITPSAGQTTVNFNGTWTPQVGLWDVVVNGYDGLSGQCTGNYLEDPVNWAPCATPRTSPPTGPYTDNDMILIEVKQNEDVPWFSNAQSSVAVAGNINLVGPNTPVAPFNPATFVYSSTPKYGAFSNTDISFANGTISQSNFYAYGQKLAPNWPSTYTGIAPSGAIDMKGATGNDCASSFNRNDDQALKFNTLYSTDLTCVQLAINSAGGGTYKVGGPGQAGTNGVAVVYVAGNGDLVFSQKFVPLDNNERLLLVLGPNIKPVYTNALGNITLSSTSPTPDIDVGIVSLKDITFEGTGAGNDKSVVVKGPIMTQSDLLLQRDRGTSNAYPAEVFEYYPKYLYQITSQTRNNAKTNYTGLTITDLQYE